MREENFDPNGYYDIEDYRDDYMTKHNRIRMFQEPIKLNEFNLGQLCNIFELFINKDSCDKFIISFSKYVKAADHTFILDLVIDKLYVYGKTFIVFTGTRPDMGENQLKSVHDTIVEYRDYNKDDCMPYLYECFEEVVLSYYDMCRLVADGKVNINLYSNCKLI